MRRDGAGAAGRADRDRALPGALPVLCPERKARARRTRPLPGVFERAMLHRLMSGGDFMSMESLRERWADPLLTALTGLLVVMMFVVAPLQALGIFAFQVSELVLA